MRPRLREVEGPTRMLRKPICEPSDGWTPRGRLANLLSAARSAQRAHRPFGEGSALKGTQASPANDSAAMLLELIV
jgi:hypothetical protein